MKNIQYLRENIIKNIILIVLLTVMFLPLQGFFESVSDTSHNSILLVTSLLIMAALFANYAFKYRDLGLKNIRVRILGHVTTFLVMLLIGILLEITVIVTNLVVRMFAWPIVLIALLFFVSTILYDFWDFL